MPHKKSGVSAYVQTVDTRPFFGPGYEAKYTFDNIILRTAQKKMLACRFCVSRKGGTGGGG